MARIRSIKPEFPQSESMGRVSRDARLLFLELWTICDDSGRTRAASRMLASLLFPYDDDAPGLIDGWLGELEHESCIRRYMAEGQTYLEICNWLKHQKIDKPSPSKIPPFDESSRIFSNPRERSSGDQGREGKGIGKEKSSCAELPQAEPAAQPVLGDELTKPEARTTADDLPKAEPFISLPTNTGALWHVFPELVAEWGKLFPAVDVPQQLRSMRAWLDAETRRRKTERGMRKFVTGWLSRAQDRGPNVPRGPVPPPRAETATLAVGEFY